jgi:hypothetical protein
MVSGGDCFPKATPDTCCLAQTSYNAVRASCGLSRMCLPAKSAGRVAYCRESGWNRSFTAEEIGQGLRACHLCSSFSCCSLCLLSDGLESCLFLDSLLSGRRPMQLDFCIKGVNWKGYVGSLLRDQSGRPLQLLTRRCGKKSNPKRFSHLPSSAIPRRLRMKGVFRLLLSLLLFIGVTFAESFIPCLFLCTKRRMIFKRAGKWYLSRLPLLVSLPGIGGRNLVVRGFFNQVASVSQSWVAQTRLACRYYLHLPAGKRSRDRGFQSRLDRQFHPGMLVPVLYDPLEPQIHVALCESFYDIAY